MPHPHYLVLDTLSHQGRTFVIGDVHGEFSGLQAVLSDLTPEDTLIIVGDLIDRGESSAEHPTSALVLNQLIQNQQEGGRTQPRIYAVKGNHEEDFLKLAARLERWEQLKNTPERIKTKFELIDFLCTFLGNGGAWTIRQNSKWAKALFAWGRHYNLLNKNTKEAKEAERHIIKLTNRMIDNIEINQGNIMDMFIPEFFMYRQYIASLPFVIKIEDEAHPAWVVHADCPLTDDELNERIALGIELDKHEIEHMTGARSNAFVSSRGSESIPVYVGHNIIDEKHKRETQTYAVHPVRDHTRTINLDGGAYFTKGFLRVNHFHHEVQVVAAADIGEAESYFLQDAAAEIQNHLMMHGSSKKRTLG